MVQVEGAERHHWSWRPRRWRCYWGPVHTTAFSFKTETFCPVTKTEKNEDLKRRRPKRCSSVLRFESPEGVLVWGAGLDKSEANCARENERFSAREKDRVFCARERPSSARERGRAFQYARERPSVSVRERGRAFQRARERTACLRALVA